MAKASYIETWEPEPGERRLMDDPRADFYAISRFGQARKMSFARMHRTHAVVTDTRIVIAEKAFMSKRHMITHVILLDPDAGTAPDLEKLSGGLFSRGFEILAARRADMTVEDAGGKPYLRIVPLATSSATNLDHCRLYSDLAADIRDAAAASG